MWPLPAETTRPKEKPNPIDALALVLGRDPLPHTTEISTLPAAGYRVTQGPFAGLLTWRFVVRFKHPTLPNSKAVVTNFILDTGRGTHSSIPFETLVALGFKGTRESSVPVALVVQGLQADFIIATPGEPGRLSADWLVKGNLVVYFDWEMYAPVMYYVDDAPKKKSSIPRTVIWKHRIYESVLNLLTPPPRDGPHIQEMTSQIDPRTPPTKSSKAYGLDDSTVDVKDFKKDSKKSQETDCCATEGLYADPPPPAYRPEASPTPFPPLSGSPTMASTSVTSAPLGISPPLSEMERSPTPTSASPSSA